MNPVQETKKGSTEQACETGGWMQIIRETMMRPIQIVHEAMMRPMQIVCDAMIRPILRQYLTVFWPESDHALILEDQIFSIWSECEYCDRLAQMYESIPSNQEFHVWITSSMFGKNCCSSGGDNDLELCPSSYKMPMELLPSLLLVVWNSRNSKRPAQWNLQASAWVVNKCQI